MQNCSIACNEILKRVMFAIYLQSFVTQTIYASNIYDSEEMRVS